MLDMVCYTHVSQLVLLTMALLTLANNLKSSYSKIIIPSNIKEKVGKQK